MFKSSIAISLMVVLVGSFSYAGQSSNYVGISAGLLLPATSLLTDRNGDSATLHYKNIGTLVSTSIGHQFEIGLRVEEEVFYKICTTNKLSYSASATSVGSSVWTIGAMSSLYYDWYHNVDVMADKSISPYIGIGAGVANVNMPEGSVNSIKVWNSGSDTVFAYQLGVGSGFKITKDTILDVAYRYFDAKDIKIDQIKTNFSNHNVLLGIRYTFK